jgi:hypothetical protein
MEFADPDLLGIKRPSLGQATGTSYFEPEGDFLIIALESWARDGPDAVATAMMIVSSILFHLNLPKLRSCRVSDVELTSALGKRVCCVCASTETSEGVVSKPPR